MPSPPGAAAHPCGVAAPRSVAVRILGPRILARRPAPRDSLGLLTVYALVLVGMPAEFVVQQLGSSGGLAPMLGIGALLWWLAASVASTRPVLHPAQPVRTMLWLLAFATLASYAVAALGGLPADQLRGADRGLLALASWLGVALVANDLLRSVESVQRLLRRVVVLGSALAVLAIVQFATGWSLVEALRLPGLSANRTLEFIGERSSFRRVAGTTSHPIELGMVLAVVFPLALQAAFTATRRRLCWGIAALTIAVAIPMSVSRSAILALAVAGVVLWCTWSAPRRIGALLVVPVFLVTMRAAVPGLLGTIKSLFLHLSSDPSIQGRTDDYQVVGRLIDQSPWLGRGFGTFLPQDFFILDNQYLGSLVETGIVGMTALIGLFVVLFFTARGIRRATDDPVLRELAQALAASTLAVGVGYAAFDRLGFSTITGLLFLLAGCTGALWRLVRLEGAGRAPGAVDTRSWRADRIRLPLEPAAGDHLVAHALAAARRAAPPRRRRRRRRGRADSGAGGAQGRGGAARRRATGSRCGSIRDPRSTCWNGGCAPGRRRPAATRCWKSRTSATLPHRSSSCRTSATTSCCSGTTVGEAACRTFPRWASARSSAAESASCGCTSRPAASSR
ncbi:MAG: O-antigen ligase family protein [Mycobacterium leprae]